MNNLIGEQGIKFDVGFDLTSTLYLAVGIFSAILLSGFLLLLIKKSMDK